MTIVFTCECGKRLKAGEQIAGRSVRCPQCERMLTVPKLATHTPPTQPPAAEPAAPSEESPFVLVLDDGLGGARAVSLADERPLVSGDQPVAAPWIDLRIEAEEIPRSDELPARPNAPVDEAPTPPLDEVVHTDEESILVGTRRGKRQHLGPSEQPLAREPWYLGWAAALARGALLSALMLSVVSPAFLLLGGLIALARTGNPRTLLDWRVGSLPVAASLVVAWLVAALLALLWAAPVLLLVDQTRRIRTLLTRLDQAARPSAPPANASGEQPLA